MEGITAVDSTTYHEGITPEKIKAKTGFELTVADTLSGARRRKKLLEIMNCKL